MCDAENTNAHPAGTRLFVKITRESLPRVKDKYPYLYLERGRLEIDDSSVKWIDKEYGVGWKGRSYIPGKFEMGDITNKILTATNTALYGILTSAVYALGYSPHIGFIHSGSPLPFVYDMADIYKADFCIDLAFSLTRELAGVYNRHKVSEEFRKRIIDKKLLEQIPVDIPYFIGGDAKNAGRIGK